MEVLIDGIRYVPATDIPVIADADRLRAVKALVTAIYLYAPRDRGTSGCIWDALRALAPDVAELAGNDLREAYAAVEALEDMVRGNVAPDVAPEAETRH